MKTYGKHKDGLIVIGDGVGIVGRWSRLFFGLNSLIYFVLNPIILNPVPKDQLADFAINRGLALAGIMAIYFVTFHFFGKLLFARLTPLGGNGCVFGASFIAVHSWGNARLGWHGIRDVYRSIPGPDFFHEIRGV